MYLTHPSRYILCFYLPIAAIVRLSMHAPTRLSAFSYRHLDITAETDVIIVANPLRATTTWLSELQLFLVALPSRLHFVVVGTAIGICCNYASVVPQLRPVGTDTQSLVVPTPFTQTENSYEP